MAERLFKCDSCGHEMKTDDLLYTGCSSWSGTFICRCCNGDMRELPSYVPGQHMTECEKALDRYDV